MVSGFVHVPYGSRTIGIHVMCAEGGGKLTAAQILARARESVGLENEEAPPPLFSDGVLDAMKTTLTLLDKRVKSGSLTSSEVSDFAYCTERIIEDLRERKNAPPRAFPVPAAAVTSSASAVSASPSLPPPPQNPHPPSPPSTPVGAVGNDEEVVSVLDSNKFDLETDFEGDTPAAENYGMASGTRNTYFIEGMENMNSEEYRRELQKQLIENSRRRKAANAGIVGNRAAMSYLDNLNGGNAPEERRYETDTTAEEYAAEMERRNAETNWDDPS